MKETLLREKEILIDTADAALYGTLVSPSPVKGLVLFAHGSGSSRHSPRNRYVASILNEAGFATLLMDLLTEEEERLDRIMAHLRFDIKMLAGRLTGTIRWIREQDEMRNWPLGLFGASTGAAAALIAAAECGDEVDAVVSRGGRPDLAGDSLTQVKVPTLLIVGERDTSVLVLNEDALERINTEKKLVTVAGASHLFEEPGALDKVAHLARSWFLKYLVEQISGSTDPPQTAQNHGNQHDRRSRVYLSYDDRTKLIAQVVEPFSVIEAAELDALLDRIGDARVVLIGEASHGTSDFYRMRQQITRALIRKYNFTIIAAEADWPDAEHVDEYIRRRDPKIQRAEDAFSRFPSWMWRNHAMLDFVEWLREYNDHMQDPHRKIGFFGLDMYSIYGSIREVLRYLEDVDSDLARLARDRYSCLMPFQADPGLYGNAVISNRYQDCEEKVVGVLNKILEHRLELARRDGERFLDAEQNARVVKSAEQYYRIMFYGSPDSWNLRDQHMFETLRALLDHRGPDSRAVVWAHNSHIGNAAATEMSIRGEHNIGQLARETFKEKAYLIGFGTHEGTVTAASYWGGDYEFKKVRPSHPKSYERLFHDSEIKRFLLHLRNPEHSEVRPQLSEPRLERAIGVIYRPETELQSHYFQAVLPDQFDEYIWFDQSEALRPLDPVHAPALPERHPFLLAD